MTLENSDPRGCSQRAMLSIGGDTCAGAGGGAGGAGWDGCFTRSGWRQKSQRENLESGQPGELRP